MSNSLIYVRPSGQGGPEDSAISSRIGIALTSRQRSGWHEIYVAVRSGVATVSGIVATHRDQKLVLDVTERVAGVLRVKNELTIGDKRLGDAGNGAFDDAQQPANQVRAPRADHFQHLPVTTESLDDILSGRPANVAL